MGEVSEMMLDGTLCAMCGVFIGTDAGVPRYCSAQCERDAGQPAVRAEHDERRIRKRLKKKGQAWRAKHRAALLNAVIEFGRDPSPKTQAKLEELAVVYANEGWSREEARVFIDTC